MISSLFFIIISVIYNVILSVVFFGKRHVKTPEMKIYGYLLITNLICLFLELYTLFSIRYLNVENFITLLSTKVYLSFFVIYFSLFFKYFLAISFSRKNYKKYIKFFNFFNLIIVIASIALIYYLPVEFSTKNDVYIYGVAIDAVYSIMSVFLLLILLVYIIRYKHIDKSKYFSCLTFIFASAFVGLIQKYFPFITLTTSVQTAVLFVMYITIENPDAKMLQQLKLAKLLIEKSNKSKNDYLTSMSHDIRTPLNSIIGSAEDIKEHNKIALIDDDVNLILESSNNIIDVVDKITDIDNDDATKLEVVNSPYNFKKEINWIIQNQINTISNSNIVFNYSIDNNIPNMLNGDKVFIKEIINNLLINSNKRLTSGEINLTITSVLNNKECKLLINVSDNGTHLKKDTIDEFDDLFINENIKVNEENLFLAITKNLVNILNGKMTITSKKGLSVSVEIIQQVFIEENIETTTNIIDYSNRRVLVVDDNLLNIRVLKRTLNGLNIFVDEVTSGIDAINKINEGNKYDLILMDIMMPKMSGTTALKKLKENPQFNTPVIALTADAEKNAKNKYLKEGFNDYLVKPYNKKQILNKMNNVFNKRN